MAYGYYLAASNSEHGDPEESQLARRIWENYVAGHPERDWKALPPGRFDGVSVYDRPAVTVLTSGEIAAANWPKETARTPRACKLIVQDFDVPPDAGVSAVPRDVTAAELLDVGVKVLVERATRP